MDLAKRDILLTTLKNQKKAKEQFLHEKNTQLSKRKNENPHLQLVVDEYTTYFSDAQQEQAQQRQALHILLDYLNQLLLDPTSTSDMIKHAKYDKSIILAEVKLIKS